jgi:pyruvate/2-oxoacid:ferredoxin oxidoreductase alpha subunit
MEPVEFPEPVQTIPERPWAVKGTSDSHNLVCSIQLDPDKLEQHNQHLLDKYAKIAENEIRYEALHCDDAEYILVGYGIVSRILQGVMEELRAEGIKVGLMRPITLMPFPKPQFEAFAKNKKIKSLFVCELSNGQMVDDVKLCVNGRKPVHFYNRMGGIVPTVKEIVEKFKERI